MIRQFFGVFWEIIGDILSNFWDWIGDNIAGIGALVIIFGLLGFLWFEVRIAVKNGKEQKQVYVSKYGEFKQGDWVVIEGLNFTGRVNAASYDFIDIVGKSPNGNVDRVNGVWVGNVKKITKLEN